MKTREQIIKMIDTTQRRIQIEIGAHYNARGDNNMITAKLHWDNHLRLQGYRDGLAWMLENRRNED